MEAKNDKDKQGKVKEKKTKEKKQGFFARLFKKSEKPVMAEKDVKKPEAAKPLIWQTAQEEIETQQE